MSPRSLTRWGIDRFVVTGGSGGGPHALAVAARLPERVIRAACNVSGALYDARDLDWFEGMDPENVKEFGWAVEGEETLVRELEREAAKLLSRVDHDLAWVKPWGFDVEEIRVPVQVRYWATDVLVPAGHGKWLARHVPNANVIIDHEAGHLSTPDEHLARLRSLVAE